MELNSHDTVTPCTHSTVSRTYDATYAVVWKALGDGWLEGHRECRLIERRTGHTLSVEAQTAYRLRVQHDGGESRACWRIELTEEDADGFGGYEVCGVASDTGHSTEALNERLTAFRDLVADGKASVLRGG